MVRRSRELPPAPTRELTAKKAKTSVGSGPHLARGRSENLLIPSRSCTPSDEEMELEDDAESATTAEESYFVHHPNSPESSRLSSAASFTPPAFSPPSTARSSMRHASYASSRDASFRREMSQDWVLPDVDEEVEGDHGILAGLTRGDHPQMTYPLRLNDTHQASSVATQSTVTSTARSPPNALVPGGMSMRSTEPGLRPLAKRPPNYRSELEHLEIPNQTPRTATGKAKGVKPPYRSQEERDKVKSVRKEGACLRCQIMRQACEVTEPGKEQCSNCEVKRRKFSIKCTREGPAARYKYLFPGVVMDLHRYENHKAKQSPTPLPGSFQLSLVHAANFSINMWVIEDHSIPESELVKTYFREEGKGLNTVNHLQIERTVPLVPVITTDFGDVARWLAKQIAENQASLFVDLPRKVFPEGKGQKWPRQVFYLFQEFHESVYRSRRILMIFKTTIVRHLMSRRFYIPFDQLEDVNAKLSEQFQETDEEIQERRATDLCMVPKFVNSYLKAALMHILGWQFEQNFLELEEMLKLREKSPGSELTDLDRDEALCYVAMILILAGIMQIKIMQVASSRDALASRNCPLGSQTRAVQNAKVEVAKIEEEVIDHILGLWTYKFVKSNRKGEVKPENVVAARLAKEFNLVGRFLDTQREHPDVMSSYTDLDLNLDDSYLPRFLIDNPTRVLLRFAETLSPSKPRRWQPRQQ